MGADFFFRRVSAVGRFASAAMDRAMAWLVILLMLAIVVQVLCSQLGINPIVTFHQSVVLFGRAVTLNSLLDVQWHLLVVVGLLPAGLVWLRDGHVRVDFLYAGLSGRIKRVVDVAGNLLFAGPFLALTIPAAWDFAARAWRTGEGGVNGGLGDLWLIKGVICLGLCLLAVAVAVDTLRAVRG